MYRHKFVLRCRVRPRSSEMLEWTGDAWLPHRGRRYEDLGAAREAIPAARAALPADAVGPLLETETYLPSAEHGRQHDLTGLRPFRVLPGGPAQ